MIKSVIPLALLLVFIAIPASAHSTGQEYNNRRIVCVQTSQGITEYFAHQEIQQGSKISFLKVTKIRVFHSWPDPPRHIGQCI